MDKTQQDVQGPSSATKIQGPEQGDAITFMRKGKSHAHKIV